MESAKSYSVWNYLYKNPLFGFALVIITAILVSILGANIRQMEHYIQILKSHKFQLKLELLFLF